MTTSERAWDCNAAKDIKLIVTFSKPFTNVTNIDVWVVPNRAASYELRRTELTNLLALSEARTESETNHVHVLPKTLD